MDDLKKCTNEIYTAKALQKHLVNHYSLEKDNTRRRVEQVNWHEPDYDHRASHAAALLPTVEVGKSLAVRVQPVQSS